MRTVTGAGVLTALLVSMLALPAHAAADRRDRTVKLGDGARLVLEPGATARVMRRDKRAGRLPRGERRVGSPLRLDVHGGGRFAATLRLRLPRSARKLHPAAIQGGYRVRAWRRKAKRWTLVPSTVDKRRKALLVRLSGHEPRAGAARALPPMFFSGRPAMFSLTEVSLDGLLQDVLEPARLRSSQQAATFCAGREAPPDWVRLSGAADEDNSPLRGCLRGEGDVAVVELVNNRPFGVILRYGTGVRFGWTSDGFGLPALMRDPSVRDGLYIPPATRAAIGVAPGFGRATFTATPTLATAAFDIVDDAFDLGAEELLQVMLDSHCNAQIANLLRQDLQLTDRDRAFDLLHYGAEAAFDCFPAVARVVARKQVKKSLAERLRSIGKKAVAARLVLKYGNLLIDAAAGGMLSSFTLHDERPVTQPGLPTTPTTPTAPTTPTTPTPQPQPQPQTKGFFVEDVFLGGTWARTDPNNGTWHSKGNRPANGAYWYPNGLGVGVDCARAAAAYTVKFADGRSETWNTWFHVTDGKWFPSAAARETSVNGFYGLPGC